MTPRWDKEGRCGGKHSDVLADIKSLAEELCNRDGISTWTLGSSAKEMDGEDDTSIEGCTTVSQLRNIDRGLQ